MLASEPPPEWLTYNLCMLFSCLPSALNDEIYEDIMALVTIHNVAQEVDEIRQKAKENKVGPHLAIVLELEKLKREE